MLSSDEIIGSFKKLQDRICADLERIDGKSSFAEDKWQRTEGGGGRTRIIKDGNVIEKGGVNFSEVHGPVTEMMKQNTEVNADAFLATGVSIVIHPVSPHIPIIHMNVRYFELSNGSFWFGGGIDLTPHYIVPENAAHFHKGLKAVCDKYDATFYTRFKKWADDYFFIPHRNETRGVGGVFFDHLDETSGLTKSELNNFCLDLGNKFCTLYEFQVNAGKDQAIEKVHEEWMAHRRGRYVEFNLVYDRGTKFGLVSGGRTESILMSLPPLAKWEYCHRTLPGSREEYTKEHLKKGIDWLS